MSKLKAYPITSEVSEDFRSYCGFGIGSKRGAIGVNAAFHSWRDTVMVQESVSSEVGTRHAPRAMKDGEVHFRAVDGEAVHEAVNAGPMPWRNIVVELKNPSSPGLAE